jgi:hypothetical protein
MSINRIMGANGGHWTFGQTGSHVIAVHADGSVTIGGCGDESGCQTQELPDYGLIWKAATSDPQSAANNPLDWVVDSLNTRKLCAMVNAVRFQTAPLPNNAGQHYSISRKIRKFRERPKIAKV